MDYLGIWKLKEMLWLVDGKFRKISDTEIASLANSERNRELKCMFRAEFIISETSLDVLYPEDEGEESFARQKGWTHTERGFLIQSFPCRIADGVLFLDYLNKGLEYTPTWVDETGCLVLSGGILKIQKAQTDLCQEGQTNDE